MSELILDLLPLLLVLLAMVTGTLLEKAHFRNIEKRERQLRHLAVLTGKEYPTEQTVTESRLVCGSVVVSIDYFKRFLAGLRNIFGGEVRSYCSLLDRGRREAILRMKEQCGNASLILNLRVETSSVSQGKKKTIGSTEVLAYGTAITFEASVDS